MTAQPQGPIAPQSTAAGIDRNTDAIVELEQQLIGWQLKGEPGADNWLGDLKNAAPEFYDPLHQRIANTILELRKVTIASTPKQVAAAMANDSGLTEIGGLEYLRCCYDSAPATAHAEDGIRCARAAFNNHRILSNKIRAPRILAEALNAINTGSADPIETIKRLREYLAEIDNTAANTPGIRPFKASVLADKDVPPRCELVERLLPLGKVAIMAGDGGTGKSLLALQLAVAIQLGTCWVGQAIFERGPVLYLTAEDDSDEIHRRLAAIVAIENVSFDHLMHLHVVSLVGEDAHLAVLNEQNTITATPLFHQLEAWTAQHKPVLIVLDTLSDLFGGNENDRTHAKAFVNLLAGLGTRHGATVLLLSHPSLSGMAKGNGLSGSTGWTGGPRSRLYLARITNQDGSEDDADIRVLRHNKANYGPAGTEVRLRWQQGVFVVDRPSDGVTTITAHAKGERVFIELVKAYTAEGRTVNANGGPNYAPTVFANDTPRNEGLTKRALADAMNRLLAAGKIRNERHGPASRSTTRLVIA